MSSVPAASKTIQAHLLKRYPSASASEAFSLDVKFETSNGVTVLLGPSGAGKSLTLNCIAGFVNPDEGRILINDRLFYDATTRVCVPPEKRRCGYVFQDHALFPHMTVRQNLRFAASVAHRDATRGLHLHRRINELLEAFELGELAARKPAQLSGGQKQRAALARILVSEPDLLLLDEPSRGLDTRLRATFYELLQQTRERLHIPMLVVTHDLDECFELADFVCLMDRGRLLQAGPRDEVFSRPANADIARRLGIFNIIPGTITALDPPRNTSHIRALDGDVVGPYLPGRLIGDTGSLCLRASEIKLVPESGRALRHDTGRNQISMNVVSAVPSPRGVRVNLEYGFFVNVSEAESLPFREGARVRLEIPASAVYFLSR